MEEYCIIEKKNSDAHFIVTSHDPLTKEQATEIFNANKGRSQMAIVPYAKAAEYVKLMNKETEITQEAIIENLIGNAERVLQGAFNNIIKTSGKLYTFEVFVGKEKNEVQITYTE